MEPRDNLCPDRHGERSEPAPRAVAPNPALWAVLATWLGAMALVAQTAHDRQVVFENSPPTVSYYHSEGRAVAPSRVELRDGRMPVDARRFSSAPNGLRLRWRSAPGGDWRMTLKVPARYGRKFAFAGDALTFRCWSEDEITEANAPRISVQDAAGVGSPTITLVTGTDRIPSGRWVTVTLPFARFVMPFNGTDDTRFDPQTLASVSWMQGLDDGREHVLWIDDVQVRDASSPDEIAPEVPDGLVARGFERHVELAWRGVPAPDLLGYRVERQARDGDWVGIGTQRAGWTRYVDFPGGTRGSWNYRIRAVDAAGNVSGPSAEAGAGLRRLSGEELLDMVQEGCFRYYWDAAHPVAGLAPEILPGDPNLIATGGNGFGIMALLVAAERGFVTRAQAAERMARIVRFLAAADRFHGAWPHFLDGRTGRVIAFFGKYDNGGDLVETSFLMQGLLAARQYFDRAGVGDAVEAEIRETITRLWHEVDWAWYRQTPESDVLYWHWSPDHAFHIGHPLIGWNETMMVYLLAVASPTHGVPGELYHTGWAGQSERHVRYRQGWGRTTDGDHYINGRSYRGHRLDVGVGNGSDLFFTHFSFLGFDPRGRRDRYANYFENNRAIARINHAYCVDNPRGWKGYGPECWGLSAGIHSGGGRPLPRDDNGTINCMAALASFPYTPRESGAALRHFYRKLGPRIWGAYGFHDGFNATEAWYEEVYMALNQGPIVVMIENHRTGLVWNKFMANPEIPAALGRIGFHEDR